MTPPTTPEEMLELKRTTHFNLEIGEPVYIKSISAHSIYVICDNPFFAAACNSAEAWATELIELHNIVSLVRGRSCEAASAADCSCGLCAIVYPGLPEESEPSNAHE